MAPYERCGGYVLLRELGQDALGTVHRAGRVAGGAIDRLVLLRKLRVEGVPAASIAHAAAGGEPLSHRVRTPYLGSYVELGTCGGEAFAAYDYQAGVTARQLLTLADDRLSPLAPDLAAVIADRAAQALMALWAAGEPGHGLVVPELIWISTEGEVRLLGAEAGRALRPAASHPDLLPFVAPEARGGAAAVEADEVWSLGALLAALLTGMAPEPDDDGAWLARTTLAEDGATLPEPIAELLGRSLVSRPQRLARVEAWHQALSRALELVGWRTAPFQLAVYMHTLLKNEMKREPAELEREREEALGRTTSVAAGTVAAALSPVGRPAGEPGRARWATEPPAVPAAAQEGPRLLGALGKDEEPEERAGRRRWLPWAALAALALAAAAGYLLLSARAADPPRAAARVATPAPAAATAPPPAPAAVAAVSPTSAPAAAELEQRLARLMEEQEKTLSDRYAREVQQLRDQLAESRRATAAAGARRPLPSAGRADAEGAQGPAASRPDAGREASAPAAPPEPAPAPAAAATATAPAAGAPPPSAAAADAPRAAPAAPLGTQLVPPRLLRFDPPDYPQLARQRGVEGTVVLSVRVAASGQVTEVRFVRRVPQDAGINEAAAAAARRARFQPATRGGVPAEAWYTLTIPFQL